MSFFDYIVGSEKLYDAPDSAREQARQVLKWRDQYGRRAMTDVGWKRANQLASGEKLTLDTVKRMAAFARHLPNYYKALEKFKGEPEKSPVIWAVKGWGGEVGIKWAQRIVESANKS